MIHTQHAMGALVGSAVGDALGAAVHAAMIRAGIRGDDVFAAIESMLGVLPGSAREQYEPWLSPHWVPDTSTNNGTVFTALAEAVWAVRHAASFEEAVVNAVDLGRDADTVACIAGGIAGARWGIQAIPRRWTVCLHGSVTHPEGHVAYDVQALQALALQLVGKKSRVSHA